MKNKTYLSLKTTLFTALPGLALSLFAVSCSDDDSTVVTDKATKGKTITFTTEAPTITDYSTRVGIDENNLPISGTDNEPLFWLEGDELAFNFVKYGASVGQVYPYTISPVGSGRYDITTDSEINISNGLYEVHVVSPGLEPGVKTFKGGGVTATTIDLRGQEQPATTDNYKNLTDYYYQYAYTLVKIEDNEIVHGGSHLAFTALTSLIRYRITNGFDDPIQVVKINVSYNDDSTSPFYTQGAFDPTAAKPAIQPVGSPVKTLGLKTDKTLAKGEQLNAFLSMLPISIPASTKITYTVFFNRGGQLYKKVWNVTAVNLANGNLPAGARWLQGLNMRDGDITEAEESELADVVEEDIPKEDPHDYIEKNGFYVTKNGDVNSNTQTTHDGSIYTSYDDRINDYCPPGFELMTYSTLLNAGIDEDQMRNFLISIDYACGYISNNNLHESAHFILPHIRSLNMPNEYYIFYRVNFINGTVGTTLAGLNNFPSLDLRCVKPII
jgi:hypothetical protein